MKNYRSTCFLLFSLFLSGLSGKVFSADTLKIEPSVGADLVNTYVWRGQLLSAGPAVQPTLDFTYGGFSLGSWASYTFNAEETQEVDLYFSYANDYVSVTLYDYYYPFNTPEPDSLIEDNSYFNLKNSTTTHTLELYGTIGGFGNIPLNFTAGVFLYGDDKNDDGDNNYSTYFELAYNKTIGANDFNAFIGITPFEGYYSDEFNVVNVGVSLAREIKITDNFSLPVTGSFIVNPDVKNVYFVFGITL